ncbi:site-specific integrase [Kitasatospora griseola]|uniref:integrase n=1 Tax=Kitasatospora griseola TaxID=2064 RepID=UPI003830B1ED
MTDRFRELADDAVLPPIRLRDVRHGAASLAHAAGADLHSIKEMLGHSSIGITSDTYTTLLRRRPGNRRGRSPRANRPPKVAASATNTQLTGPSAHANGLGQQVRGQQRSPQKTKPASHPRWKSEPPVGFEPTTPALQGLASYN